MQKFSPQTLKFGEKTGQQGTFRKFLRFSCCRLKKGGIRTSYAETDEPEPTMSVVMWQLKPLEFDVRWRSSLPFDWHQDQERTSTDTGGITWHLTKE